MDDSSQKSAVRKGYDALADEYDDARSSDTFPADPFERFRSACPDDGRILDAGCGAAQGVLPRLSTAATGIGLDVSTEQLRLGRDRTEADLLAGDMTRLPFVDSVFDGVTAFHSTIHVPLDEHAALYEEFARVLRPGGQLLLTASDVAWVGENADWLGTGERMVWSYPDAEETRELLADAGFDVVERVDVHSEMDDATWPFLRCRLPEQ